MLKQLSVISMLVACSAVYAAGTGEPPAATPAAAEPAKRTGAVVEQVRAGSTAEPAAEPAKPAAEPAKPAAEPTKPAAEPTKPAAAPVAEPAKPAAAPDVDLSGKWSSNGYDDIVIEQTGKKITGTYQYKDDEDVTQEGKFEGMIDGKTIKAKWLERPKVGKGEESRGDVEWTISDDGKMLAGFSRNEGEEDKEDWNLNR